MSGSGESSNVERKVLTRTTINPHFINIEYAVRGPIVQRASEIEAEIKSGAVKPFSEVIKCNIGDCHATGQNPIKFFREIIAALSLPALLDGESLPLDVKSKAHRLLASCSGSSSGSYSDSLGLAVVREDVARFIQCRDQIPSDAADVFLTTGASEAIKYVMNLLSTGKDGNERAGIMVPIPQYPLYSATCSELNICKIDYYLDESQNWDLTRKELERALAEVRGKCVPRAIVVINPGNPTGQVLSRKGMEEVVRFAVENRLVLLADEVYQFNVYQPEVHPWTSFKRVLHDLGPEYSDRLELASFMSASKGFMGECGFRGGYCELVNFDPFVKAQLYKALSARLCSPVMGQVMIGCFVNPPQKGDPSYLTYSAERDAVLRDLRVKAELISKVFNSMPGVSCNPVQGAMYAFPRIDLPRKAILAAQERKEAPDFFYCLQFLEQKGICVVPGSGFGQTEGTYHFRTTILPSVEKMQYVLECFRDFHSKFMEKYSD